MAQSNIGIRFNIDASQGKSQVDELSKSAAELTKKIKEAKDAGNWKEFAMLSEALNNTTSARGQIIQQVKQSNPQAEQNMANALMQSGAFIMLQSALSQLSASIIKTAETFHSAKVQKLSGDYMGAHISETRAKGEVTADIVTTLINGAITAYNPALGMALAPMINQIGRYLGGTDARKAEIIAAGSQQYKNVLPLIDSLNQLYGGAINQRNFEENNAHGLSMYSRAAEKTAGTGLSTEDFIAAMKETGKYGNLTEAQALDMTHEQARWSRFTGAELSVIQKYGGTAYRYAGEKDGASTAYAGMLAQNMGKGQYSEYLNSMSRIMEEGISKGFIRSSKEVAGNMAMLYKLSGNSALWQGEQGAQRLSQMNNALASATNLENVEHFIDFGVAKQIIESMDKDQLKALETGLDGKKTGFVNLEDNRANTMQLLSMGFRPEILAGQFETITQLDTGSDGKLDVFSAMQRYKSRGFNDLGAAQIVNMMQESGSIDEETGKWKWKENYTQESVAKYIDDLRQKPQYLSDSENMQRELNKMNLNLVKIGNANFSEEMKILDEQARNVANIWAMMNGGKKEIEERASEVADIIAPNIFDTFGGGSGAHIHLGLQEIANAQFSSDPNAAKLGARFNTEHVPLLGRHKDNENVIRLINEINDDFYAARSVFRGDRKKTVGDKEASDLNIKFDTLTSVLQRLEMILTGDLDITAKGYIATE